jgi:thiamine biosynthesis lipoprotein
MKNKLLVLFLLIINSFSCKTPSSYIFNEGFIYGTIYHIVYDSPGGKNLQPQIDAKLKEYELVFSTFNKESVISKVNTNQPVELGKYFINCFNKSQEVSEKSGGAFDITVAPLVNAWGFGFTKKEHVTQKMIDSMLQFVGYKKVKLVNGLIVKENPSLMLDMSAISKGYTCDLIGFFLKDKGCKSYMVEIGGEVAAHGVNPKGIAWSIGISKPEENASIINQDIQAVVRLPGRALATSGNYRNFYEENGKKYAHTIDPETGYPVQHSLLSATVLADDCMTADAYATAFMVLGLEKGIELAKKIPGLEIYFIYTDTFGVNQVYMSENFKKSIAD